MNIIIRIGAAMAFTATVLSFTSCSNDEVPDVKQPAAVYDPEFTSFEETGEVALDGVDMTKFTARALRVKGDTMFVANNHADDRSVYLFSLSQNKQIGKISKWVRGGTEETFSAEIGDIAVSGKYIFVGLYSSRIYVFERKTLNYVNVIGCASGTWGSGVNEMVHCYGIREFGDRIVVRDKESIRVYWIYEAVTEAAFNVPWLGKVMVKEGIGYDYSPRQHGMVNYKGKVYLDDPYLKTIQVADPAKMQIKEFGDSPINRDTVYSTGTVTPAGLCASGGSLFISVAGTGKINRFHLQSGENKEGIAVFANRQIGRMEIVNDDLYFIDLKTGRIVKAKGIK